MEVWNKIPNFSRYEASSLGRLRSINYKNTGKKVVLKPSICEDGYLKTMLLSDNGKYKSWRVHKFVALAFLGLIPKGLEINHIDGNKQNNRPSNLEYCTRSYNCKHSFDLGLQKPKKGELNGMAKLTEKDVLDIREHAKNSGRFYGRKELAEKYGVSEGHIKDIISKRRGVWSHI